MPFTSILANIVCHQLVRTFSVYYFSPIDGVYLVIIIAMARTFSLNIKFGLGG